MECSAVRSYSFDVTGHEVTMTWRHVHLDRWGIALSSLCAIHCLAIPAAFALLPSLTVALHSFEAPSRRLALWLLRLQAYDAALVGVALLVAWLSFGTGWRRHRCWRPFGWWLAAALAFAVGLCFGSLPYGGHGLALASGGILLVIGHVRNLRLLRVRQVDIAAS